MIIIDVSFCASLLFIALYENVLPFIDNNTTLSSLLLVSSLFNGLFVCIFLYGTYNNQYYINMILELLYCIQVLLVMLYIIVVRFILWALVMLQNRVILKIKYHNNKNKNSKILYTKIL